MSLSQQTLMMGGYAYYVWPAYFITFFVFGFNFLNALAKKKKVKKRLAVYFQKFSHEFKT